MYEVILTDARLPMDAVINIQCSINSCPSTRGQRVKMHSTPTSFYPSLVQLLRSSLGCIDLMSVQLHDPRYFK